MATSNATVDPYDVGVSSCFNAQTFLGSSNEYDNRQFNADIGGACVAIASK
jgi:hypothetical protein